MKDRENEGPSERQAEVPWHRVRAIDYSVDSLIDATKELEVLVKNIDMIVRVLHAKCRVIIEK